MYITQDDKNLIISFDYNPILIGIVKQIGCAWDKNHKWWSAPKSETDKIINTLTKLGFVVDTRILETKKENNIKRKKIDRILAGNFKECEKELFDKSRLPLFEFQKRSCGFMCVTKNSILGLEPGCGKSVTSLAFTVINNTKNNLIVCPASLKWQWQSEIYKWIPNAKVYVVDGIKKKRDEIYKKALKEENTFYLVINYELLIPDLDVLKNFIFCTIFADEATRINNQKAKQSKNIKELSAKYKFALTGTPLNNKIEDLWSVLDFCQPNVLGNYWQFINKYCVKQKINLKEKIGKNGDVIKARSVNLITGYKNLGELKSFMYEYMVRYEKQEVLDQLPPKLYEDVIITLTDKEKEIYKNVQENILSELKELTIDTKYINDALVKLVRLKQVCDSLELVSDLKISSKLEALKELLKDILQDNSKVIVFTQFAKMAEILNKELKEYSPLLITGETSLEDRKKRIDIFMEDSEHKIIVSSDALSFGVNLHRANYVVHYDMPWSLSKKIQREDRAHRHGQTKNVTIYQMIVKDSVDEYVVKVLQKKEKLSEEILGDSEKLNKIRISKAEINKLLK